jgi:hypothetical protein
VCAQLYIFALIAGKGPCERPGTTSHDGAFPTKHTHTLVAGSGLSRCEQALQLVTLAARVVDV